MSDKLEAVTQAVNQHHVDTVRIWGNWTWICSCMPGLAEETFTEYEQAQVAGSRHQAVAVVDALGLLLLPPGGSTRTWYGYTDMNGTAVHRCLDPDYCDIPANLHVVSQTVTMWDNRSSYTRAWEPYVHRGRVSG